MNRCRCLATTFVAASLLIWCGEPANAQPPAWQGYAGNAQHTGISNFASSPLAGVGWSTQVDLNPQYTSGGALLAHYGSPMITNANTVIVPVKTGASDGFTIRAFNGGNGALLWTQATDYSRPASSWVPSYSATLTPTERLYYATAGGTVSYRDGVNGSTPSGSGQIAFFGNAAYAANPTLFNQNVKINTPITSDAFGNIFFGYQVTGTVTVGGNPLLSGIARIGADGSATYMAASSYDSTMAKVAMNSAPALSNDGQTLYFTINKASSGNGALVAVNANTLSLVNKATLFDPRGAGTTGATVPDVGTASVTVGPDGHVYMGSLENPFTNSKGWMQHYDGTLNTRFAPGAFGWDITSSIIPESMVDAMRTAGTYNGTSDYLIMTKYNDYANFAGGTGINRLAILDPNATQVNNGVTVMKEVLTIAGITPDEDFPNHPGAVREWCINAAAVDPFTNSVLVNSEDGRIYRWSLLSNTFTEFLQLTEGIGQAYTPTLIGPDGTVYAINNARLFGVRPVPEPAVLLLVSGILVPFALLRRLNLPRAGRIVNPPDMP
jgi:hypothetical protein